MTHWKIVQIYQQIRDNRVLLGEVLFSFKTPISSRSGNFKFLHDIAFVILSTEFTKRGRITWATWKVNGYIFRGKHFVIFFFVSLLEKSQLLMEIIDAMEPLIVDLGKTLAIHLILNMASFPALE